MTINNPVLEAAKAKFGKVICYSSRLDGAHRLAILRDDAPLPHVPYMAITAWPDRQNGESLLCMVTMTSQKTRR